MGRGGTRHSAEPGHDKVHAETRQTIRGRVRLPTGAVQGNVSFPPACGPSMRQMAYRQVGHLAGCVGDRDHLFSCDAPFCPPLPLPFPRMLTAWLIPGVERSSYE